MGDPKLILLDEPSTYAHPSPTGAATVTDLNILLFAQHRGLDPKSKRALWSAISARKKQSALILTTHSMEEAEALCNRIVRFVSLSLSLSRRRRRRCARKGTHVG